MKKPCKLRNDWIPNPGLLTNSLQRHSDSTIYVCSLYTNVCKQLNLRADILSFPCLRIDCSLILIMHILFANTIYYVVSCNKKNNKIII